MKKTLLAAALLAGFATAGIAQAETSVTLYGILDGGIGYQQLKGNTSYNDNRGDSTAINQHKTGMLSGIQSGNRWGMRGVEDLGDGLRAEFNVESGFDLSTGNSLQGDRLFGRRATLGLASDSWGRLDFGRQSSISTQFFGQFDPFAQGFDQANIGAAFSALNTNRYDNTFAYQTPNFSGFKFGVGYSFNVSGSQPFNDKESDLSDQRKGAISTALSYNNGPLALGLSYDQLKVPATAANTSYTFNSKTGLATGNTAVNDTNIRSWNLGAAYDFEVVKAYLAFGQTRNGLFAQQTFSGGNTLKAYQALDGLKVNSYLVGLSAPIGNGSLLASWTMADPTSRPDNTNGQEWKKQNAYNLGYTYNLSKRTNLYAIGSYVQHAYFLPDAKSTLVGIGLRHKF